jgi:hypothetical protein
MGTDICGPGSGSALTSFADRQKWMSSFFIRQLQECFRGGLGNNFVDPQEEGEVAGHIVQDRVSCFCPADLRDNALRQLEPVIIRVDGNRKHILDGRIPKSSASIDALEAVVPTNHDESTTTEDVIA